MAVAVATLPRPLLAHVARISRRTPLRPLQRALARQLKSLYTLSHLLRSLRLVLLRAGARIPALASRQVARLARPAYANKLARAQVRANLKRLLKRLLQQLALRIVLGLLPGIGTFSPLILNAVTGLVGSAASSASGQISAQLVAYLPPDFVTRTLELARLYVEMLREEVAARVEVGSVVEYLRLVELAEWRISLERLGGLEGLQAAFAELGSRTGALVFDSVIKPSPKALLA